MKKITYPAFYRFPARYTFALLTMAGSGSVAMADGKISMDAFSLAPGQTVTVAVNLTQTGDVYGFQTDVALPNGLKLVSAKADADRVERGVHTFQYEPLNNGEYRFLVTPQSSYTISGEKGLFFELTLEADENFTGGNILFNDVVFSLYDGTSTPVKSVQEDFSVSVALAQLSVGDFSVAADLLTIQENGGPYVVEVSLDNHIPVKGLEGSIALPEGLTIKKNSKGRYEFNYGSRLTDNAVLDYNDKNGRFVLIDMTTTDFWEDGGMLFSFEVVPDESKLAQSADIVLGSFIVATTNGAAVESDQQLVVKVDNSAYFKTSYDKFFDGIEAVRQDCQDAKETLQNHYKEVAADYLSQLETVLEDLGKEESRIQQELAAGTLPGEVALDLQPYTDSITRILAEAKAAESEYLYAGFDKTLAQLAIDLADTKAALENYPDVKDSFAKRIADVETTLAEVKAFIEESKASGTNAMDLTSAKEALQAMDAELIQILADAKAAQSDFLYAGFDKALAQLAIDLADTKAALENYPDVKDNFAKRIADVETTLVEVKAFIEESKAAGTNAMDLTSAKEALQAMDAELIQILADAKTAESDYLYTAFDKTLAQLATDLADTKEALEGYADVKDNFAKRIADVETALNDVKAFIEESKAAGTNAMDLTSAKEALQSMDAELIQILADAKAAQSDYLYAAFDKTLAQLAIDLADTKVALNSYPDVKDNFAKRIADVETTLAEVKGFIEENKAAGTNAMDLTSAKEALQAMDAELIQILAEAKAAESEYLYAGFDKTLAQLAIDLADTKAALENYPDVKDSFAKRIADVETTLAEVKAFIEESKAAGTNAMDLTSAKEALQAMDAELIQILADAKSAQSDFTYAAYETKLAELKQSFEETKAYISTYLPDVAAQFEEQLAGIAQNIENFSTIMAEAKAAGKPAMELQFGTEEFAAVDEQLAALLADAKTAQSDFIYANYETTLKELAAAYTAAGQELQENYAEVAADFEERMAAVAENIAMLNDALAEAKQQHVMGMDLQFGAAEFKMVADEIAAILKEAQDKQNLLSYDGLEQLILKLQNACAEALDYVKTQCPDADRIYAARLDNYKYEIMDWAGIFATGKANNTPVDKLGFNQKVYDDLQTKIQTAVNDAKQSQSDFLYNAYETKLAELAADCADTKAYIETYLPNVAQQYAATMEKAGQDIENFGNTIKSFKAAGKLAQELKFGMADLEAIDQNMTLALAEAKAAESAYLYMEYEQKLTQLATDLADTKEALEGYADVKDNFAKRIADVETAIAEVKGFIEESKAAGTYAMDLASAKEALQSIDAELVQILADAKATQSEYLYAEFDKTLAQLATDLADTKAALENYPDVKDSFAERIAAVETALAEVKGFIEESKAAGTNAMDLTSAKEALQAMDAELIQILADAKAAESEYLYAAFDKTLAQLATDLADTKEALENYPDVKDSFAERIAAVETAIADLKAFVEESKAAGMNAMDLPSSEEAIEAINAELIQILADARAAQSDYLYAAFDKALAQLATDLADTKEALNSYPDVKDDFAERIAAVETAIADLKAFVEESKAAGMNAMDLPSGEEAIEAIDAELIQILADARAAQSDFIYAQYEEKVAALAEELAATRTYLSTELAEVAPMFAEELESIAQSIESFTTTMSEAKAAGKPAMELQFGMEEFEAVSQQMAAILEEAKAVQEAYNALYANYTAQIQEVQTALEEAVKYIETECADVADKYEEIAAEIQAKIEAVKAEVEAAKTSGNLFDFVFSVADIKVAIDEMLQAAIDEQQTVGIGLIELDGEQPVRIYSTSGVQSDKVIKGKVNIVRMPDGTVKKIFVK